MILYISVFVAVMGISMVTPLFLLVSRNAPRGERYLPETSPQPAGAQ